MAQPPAPPEARPPFRVLRLHGVLLTGLATAAVITLAAPVEWRWTVRLAAGWDAGVALFLLLTFLKLARTQSVEAIRARAAELDEAGVAVLPLSLLAAAASVALVVSEAASASSGVDRSVEALLTLGTVAASWLFVHVLFGLHYAHRFYAPDEKGDRGGLLFPGETEPDYWDFLHFSLIIGVASQTADVQIADQGLRRLSTVHSVTAFVFNTVLVALAVNLAVSLI
ncbi:MAG: hypothetical protein B7Y86_00670 [Brevundimonas subvibrioides]|uniref:DUF1345 domain-containing protein n=1 Tax=Brevundimonas subvibrioides TaxID=74313 RepID=A0A258HQ43_9CAUL|nr:DUF1345 domain-containing protein [Brevundimonas subvibrioides]OYX58976.1 MAG: hypothetical protein B7Y86_00670 [Brevundimonas subvibrioides]